MLPGFTIFVKLKVWLITWCITDIKVCSATPVYIDSQICPSIIYVVNGLLLDFGIAYWRDRPNRLI